jgi:hypothetical protein
MKKLIVLGILFYHGFTFSQDTTQVKHSEKISNLLNKVNVINEGQLNNKEQIINKSKIDELMLKIEALHIEQKKLINENQQDSLFEIIEFLKSSNQQKDSLISALKTQLSQQKSNIQPYTVTTRTQNSYSHKYIVLGAYQIKSNAEKQVSKLRNYNLELIPTHTNKLHYVVYKMKQHEKINETLHKFRNQVDQNAWYISF